MPFKSRRNRAALGLAMVLSGAVAVAALGRLTGSDDDFSGRLMEVVSGLERRLDAIETSIQVLERADRGDASNAAFKHSSARTDVDLRITAIEDMLAELVSSQRESERVPSAETEQAPNYTYADPLLTESVNKMPLTHASETGTSPWGEALSLEVESQYSSDPFFDRFGGELSTDCRQTTCKLTWFMPPPENIAPEELDLMQSTAQYELATLAAREGQSIGQFEVEWDASGGAPYVTVYLRRPE